MDEAPVNAVNAADLPFSTIGPVALLLRQSLLEPPQHPGLLANLDRFHIVGLLGAGGMGVVLLVRDSHRGDVQPLVAIKLPHPQWAGNAEVAHQFVVEARHMQALSHPNILPVLEISDHGPHPYFVMPYVEHGSLAALLQRGQPLEPKLSIAVLRQIATALVFTHSRGIIHRDLKPANILVDGQGRAYLSDFGLVRTFYKNDSIVNTRDDQAQGTAPYMSPAVAAGHAEDTRCDIYSLGAVLYEMVTGMMPYDGPTSQAIREKIMAGPPPPILTLNPQALPSLVTIVEGAMARDLRDRYAQMSDVMADLERLARGESPLGARDYGRQPDIAQRDARTRSLGLTISLPWVKIVVALSASVLVLLLLAGSVLMLDDDFSYTPPKPVSTPQASVPSLFGQGESLTQLIAPQTNATSSPAVPPAPPPVPAPMPAPAAVPATEAAAPQINLAYFQQQLAPFGTWVEDRPQYGGPCWVPTQVLAANPDWRPYYDMGRWVNTENGWFWQSDYAWGDIPFHYGRWVVDPVYRWLWVPDYTWGPAWVCWRQAEADGYIGWAPLPYGAVWNVGGWWDFHGRRIFNADFDFGLGENAFVFVDNAHFRDDFFRMRGHEYRFNVQRKLIHGFYGRTAIRNVFRPDEHGRLVNEGLGRDRIEHLTHQKVEEARFQERIPESRPVLVKGVNPDHPTAGVKSGHPAMEVSKVYRPPVSKVTPPPPIKGGPPKKK